MSVLKQSKNIQATALHYPVMRDDAFEEGFENDVVLLHGRFHELGMVFLGLFDETVGDVFFGEGGTSLAGFSVKKPSGLSRTAGITEGSSPSQSRVRKHRLP